MRDFLSIDSLIMFLAFTPVLEELCINSRGAKTTW